MENVLKKGIIIVGVYIIFTFYLLAVSERIERLEENGGTEKTSISLNISEEK